MGFPCGNEAARPQRAVGLHKGRLATVFLEGDAAVAEARAHVVDQHCALLPVLVGGLDLLVGGQCPEELGRAQHMHAGRELAGEPIFHVAQQLQAGSLDLPVVGRRRKLEGHRLRSDVELVEQIDELTAISVEDLALERTHAQMLQGDRVLVAHGLQMAGHDTADGFHFGFGTEGAQSLHFLGQHHVVVGDVRDHEGAQVALATFTHRAGRTGRAGGQQVQTTGVLLDDDLPGAHRLGREQVELLQPPIAVGQEVDGGRQAGHREAGVFKRVLHLGSPEMTKPASGGFWGE